MNRGHIIQYWNTKVNTDTISYNYDEFRAYQDCTDSLHIKSQHLAKKIDYYKNYSRFLFSNFIKPNDIKVAYIYNAFHLHSFQYFINPFTFEMKFIFPFKYKINLKEIDFSTELYLHNILSGIDGINFSTELFLRILRLYKFCYENSFYLVDIDLGYNETEQNECIELLEYALGVRYEYN